MDNDLGVNIISAQYVVTDFGKTVVKCEVEGAIMCVPLDPANRHYAEILRQVEAGTLVIQEAAVE